MPDCCTSVLDLIKRASTLLNDDVVDNDFVRWPKAVLLDYLNEGIGLLSAHRPDLFTKCVELTLKPGQKQQLSNKYLSLVSVDFSVSPDGVLTPVTKVDLAYSRYVTKSCAERGSDCKTPESTGITTYSNVPKDEQQFFVYPAVSRRGDVTVMATVVERPCQYCVADFGECVDIPPGQQAALVDWMVHRAYSTDIESEYAYRAAQAALARFERVLSVTYLQESRFESGYYKGQEGKGDPNTTPRSRY
jgi:hypothetical protein